MNTRMFNCLELTETNSWNLETAVECDFGARWHCSLDCMKGKESKNAGYLNEWAWRSGKNE